MSINVDRVSEMLSGNSKALQPKLRGHIYCSFEGSLWTGSEEWVKIFDLVNATRETALLCVVTSPPPPVQVRDRRMWRFGVYQVGVSPRGVSSAEMRLIFDNFKDVVPQRFHGVVVTYETFADPLHTEKFFQTLAVFSVCGRSKILCAQKKMKKVFSEV